MKAFTMPAVTSQNVLSIRNPFNGEVFAEVPRDDDASIEQKLCNAAAAFAAWKRTTLDQRIAAVRQAGKFFDEHRERIAKDITLQMGKPLAQARGEVNTMLSRLEQSIADAPTALQPDELPRKDGLIRRTVHEPLGIVFDIAAWNYPLLIAVNVVAPAILAGNVVIIKHAATTPLCGQAFEDAFTNASVKHLVTNLVVSHEQAAGIIADERVAHVSFTGSVRGGRHIYKHVAATRFIDCGLELGGKDPAYVAADAEVQNAAANLVDGAMYNAGQSCCAIERAYIHESLYDAFLEKAAAVINDYTLGDPLDESTSMGPMSSKSSIAELQQQVDDAIKRGGRLIAGGHASKVPDGFYPPTLIADVPNDALIMQEESFGPLLPVAPVKDDDQAVAMMNDTRFGLTASVWTKSIERAERFASEVNAGTVFMNRCDYVEPAQPWSGYGDSGKGSTLSRYGFWHLTRRKSVHFRP